MTKLETSRLAWVCGVAVSIAGVEAFSMVKFFEKVHEPMVAAETDTNHVNSLELMMEDDEAAWTHGMLLATIQNPFHGVSGLAQAGTTNGGSILDLLPKVEATLHAEQKVYEKFPCEVKGLLRKGSNYVAFIYDPEVKRSRMVAEGDKLKGYDIARINAHGITVQKTASEKTEEVLLYPRKISTPPIKGDGGKGGTP